MPKWFELNIIQNTHFLDLEMTSNSTGHPDRNSTAITSPHKIITMKSPVNFPKMRQCTPSNGCRSIHSLSVVDTVDPLDDVTSSFIPSSANRIVPITGKMSFGSTEFIDAVTSTLSISWNTNPAVSSSTHSGAFKSYKRPHSKQRHCLWHSEWLHTNSSPSSSGISGKISMNLPHFSQFVWSKDNVIEFLWFRVVALWKMVIGEWQNWHDLNSSSSLRFNVIWGILSAIGQWVRIVER